MCETRAAGQPQAEIFQRVLKLIGRRAASSFFMPVEHNAQKIRIKLFQDVVRAGIREVDAPILEDRTCGPVLHRIIRSGNSLLQELTQNLRSVESWIAGIGARNHRTGGRIMNAIPNSALSFSKVSRVIVQHVGQKAKNKKSRGNLVRLGRTKSLLDRPPPLPVVSLAIP